MIFDVQVPNNFPLKVRILTPCVLSYVPLPVIIKLAGCLLYQGNIMEISSVLDREKYIHFEHKY